MENSDFDEKYNKRWNAYFYPNTEVFVNKMNITDEDELYKYEREMVDNKLLELHNNPIEGEFDIKHLCDIHKYLFGDLYEWAGKFRDVYMRKVNGSYFAPVDRIEEYLLDDIKVMKEELRHVYNLETLADFITNAYVAFLNTHPFREGNGRAVREFLREYVVNKTRQLYDEPYDIDWNIVNHQLVSELIPFGRAYSTSIKMEILKALVPYNKIVKK